jgi:DNA-binding NarL/FixJ family response regulator
LAASVESSDASSIGNVLDDTAASWKPVGVRRRKEGPSRRELEVAALIRQGLRNAEIAERLALTPGTVANHVANILGRLNLRNRTQLAAWAAEHGVGDSMPGLQQPDEPPRRKSA